MDKDSRQTRSYLMRLFGADGRHPRHDLGQNFLIDLNIIEYIAREAEIDQHDVVLEVGTGTGGLTTSLVRDAAAVVSVEIDPAMHALAAAETVGCPNLTLLNCDALRTKTRLSDRVLHEVQTQLALVPGARLKLVANLPYGVATPVVSNLAATNLPWTRMVVTIQYELGLRMQAGPGENHYGGLAVWLQSQASVRMLKKLGPKVFWPRPDVDSAIMRIDASPEQAARIADRSFFHEFVRQLFQQRRKTLRTVLAGMYRRQLGKPRIGEMMASLTLSETVRAEDVDVSSLVKLGNAIHAALASVAELPSTEDQSNPGETGNFAEGQENW